VHKLGTVPRLVVAQEPAPGTPVRRGTPVVLTVWGPLPSIVPDLTGLSLPQARRVLGPTGLAVSVGSGPRAGVVRDQSPAPGSSVAPGTVVVVGLDPVPARVPWGPAGTGAGLGALGAGLLVAMGTALRARRRASSRSAVGPRRPTVRGIPDPAPSTLLRQDQGAEPPGGGVAVLIVAGPSDTRLTEEEERP